MKNLYIVLTVILLFLSNYSKAQVVRFSHAFGDYLERYYIPGAVVSSDATSYYINVYHPDVLALTDLDITYGGIEGMDITGIEWFENVTTLRINSRFFYEILVLPPNIKTLTVSSDSFSRLQYLNYSSLRYLEINNAPNFQVLPSLPDSLESIRISNTGLVGLPNMPSNLKYLRLNGNKNFTALPFINSALQILEAPNNGITSVGAFPPSMFTINLSRNPLTHLTNLPNLIGDIDLSFTPVVYTQTTNITINTNMWAMFPSILKLDSCPGIDIHDFVSKIVWDGYVRGINFSAAYNGLTSFPQFKTFVRSFDLSNNPIAANPTMADFRNCSIFPGACNPFSNLGTLKLENCGLSELNLSSLKLPKLYTLSLNGNDFKYLDLDSFQKTRILSLNDCNIRTLVSSGLYAKEISLRNNNISCLPFIGDSVTKLDLTNNPILCIPNAPKNTLVNLPVCPNTCDQMPVISGTIFNDLNQDGIKNISELPIPDILVKLNPNGIIVKSDSNGNYQFKCLPGQSYDLVAYPHSAYAYVTTPLSTLHISAMLPGTIDSLRSIGIYNPTVNDLQMKLTSQSTPRPGFSLTYRITASNIGSTTQNGSATFKFDPSLIFQSASGSVVQSGDSIIWTFSNLLPAATFQYDATFNVPATTPLGASLCARAIANGNMPDTSIYNNRDSICQTVIGSYDPNDKTAYPGAVLTKEQMLSGEGVDYVVRFQNTGTASAISVRVEDTISPLLEAGTLQMIASSHVNDWRIDSGNVLKVFFNNINLPDSGANELLSHGFFRYSIKPKAGTAIGDSIKNTALIYFDFNAPIVTNTVKTNVTTLFATPIATQTVCEGQPLTLSFTDNPAISKIEWLRNDTLLAQTGPSLNIASISGTDRGLYNVRITLHSDAVFYSPKAQIDIAQPLKPEVLIAHASPALCAGLPASFSAYPTNGGANPSYQWFVNGVSMPGDSALFTIPSLRDSDMVFAVMTSSLSCVTKPTDTSNIRILEADSSVTPFVQLLTDSAPVCRGSNALFTAISQHQGSAPTYTWYVNGIPQSGGGSTFNTNTLNSTDKVSVVMHSSLECILQEADTSTEVSRSVSTSVTPSVAIGLSNVTCSGTSATLAASSSNQGTAPIYQWFINGQLLQGASNDSLILNSVQAGDSIRVEMTSSIFCTTSPVVSASQIINVQTSADISITGIAQKPHYYSCYGEPKTFTVLGDDFGYMPLYTWFLNGKEVASGIDLNSIQIDTLNPGDSISISASSGSLQCINDTSLSLSVAVFAPVPKPVIALSGSTLYTDTSTRIQWMQAGHPITGATATTYQAKANDAYHVQITDAHGCTAVSDTIQLVVLGLGYDIATSVRVFPNPFSTVLTLQLGSFSGIDEWSFRLVNVSGQVVQQQSLSQSNTTLQLQQLPAGIYMLHIHNQAAGHTFRVVKY